MVASHSYKLSAYPKDVALRDGEKVVLKPMSAGDTEALLQLFLRIPAEDRCYLKEGVTSPKVIQRWAVGLDYDRALPLLVWANGKVVAEAGGPGHQGGEFVRFVKVGVLPRHAKDLDGHPRDVVLMEMPLGKWFEWWPSGRVPRKVYTLSS